MESLKQSRNNTHFLLLLNKSDQPRVNLRMLITILRAYEQKGRYDIVSAICMEKSKGRVCLGQCYITYCLLCMMAKGNLARCFIYLCKLIFALITIEKHAMSI